MSVLDEVEWGDVLADGEGFLVLEGRLGDDAVLVKRWQGDVLDAELTARRLLAAAGVPTLDLIGHGPGWMVLEALGETMWRPAGAADLDDPQAVRALARWLAAAHRVAPQQLPASATHDLLGPELLALVAGRLPVELLDGLATTLPTWQRLLSAQAPVLALGAFSADAWALLGDSRAMPTDLASCHAGGRAEDVALVCQQLDADMARVLVDEYRSASAASDEMQPALPEELLAAARGAELAFTVVVGALAEQPVDERARAELEHLLAGTGYRG